jgi:predicted ATPase
VHRDVKPANVLVSRGDGTEHAYLTDFGLTKSIGANHLTRTGQIVGTLDYLAPEQIEGGEVDGRVDVYALGCMLYQCLTGAPPFAGSEAAVLWAHIQQPPPRPSDAVSGLPGEVDAVVARSLAKRPDERFQTAGDFARAARGAISGAGLIAAPSGEGRDSPRLPREPSPIIGRDAELSQLTELALAERLVTLTGPGGSGKTRLALGVSWHVAQEFDGLVAFASLAAVQEVSQVAVIVARAIGLEGLLTTWNEIVGSLCRRHTLLVIDNAEHLPDLGSLLAELLDGAPHVHLLVTSRAPVGVEGERLYPVEPLGQQDGVALLCERVRAHRPDFRPNDAEQRQLESLAKSLAGLPLALELAAARMRALPAAALLVRIDHQLDLLATTRRDLPERQRTMRGAIEWSYRMLDDEAAGILMALSVFPAPARLEAIAAAAAADEIDTLNGLARLIDSSLVRLAGTDDTPRYGMLEPIRRYAEEQMTSSGDRDLARDRMLTWFRDAADSSWRRDEDLLSLFRPDIDNILRCLSYAASTERWSLSIELVHRLAMDVFYSIGVTDALRPWLESLTAKDPDLTPYLRGQLDLALVVVNGRSQAVENSLQAIRWLEECDDEELLLYQRAGLAHDVVLIGGDVDAGRLLIRDAKTMRINHSASAALLAAAEALLAEFESSHDAPQRWAHAVDLVRCTKSVFLRIGVPNDAAYAAAASGDGVNALRWSDMAVRRALAADLPAGEFAARHTAAVAALIAGDLSRSVDEFAQVLLLAERVSTSNREELPEMLHSLVALLGAAGRPRAAARLNGAVAPATFTAFGRRVTGAYEPQIDRTRQQLGEGEWRQLEAGGADLAGADLLQFALDQVIDLRAELQSQSRRR